MSIKIKLLIILSFLVILTPRISLGKTIDSQSDDTGIVDLNYNSSSICQKLSATDPFNSITIKEFDHSGTFSYSIKEKDPAALLENAITLAAYNGALYHGGTDQYVDYFIDFKQIITPQQDKEYWFCYNDSQTPMLKGTSDESTASNGKTKGMVCYYGCSYFDLKNIWYKLTNLPKLESITQTGQDETTEIQNGGTLKDLITYFKLGYSHSVIEQIKAEIKLVKDGVEEIVASNDYANLGGIAKSNLRSGPYSWAARFLDADNNATNWMYMANQDQSSSGFRGFTVDPRPIITDLKQFEGVMEIPEGGQIIGNSITVKANVYSPDNNTVKAKIELKKLNELFDGTNLMETDYFVANTPISATFNNLEMNKYHWRIKLIDSQNNESDWRNFGAYDNEDFYIGYWNGSKPLEQTDSSITSPYWMSNIYYNLGTGLSGTSTNIQFKVGSDFTYRYAQFSIFECENNSNKIGYLDTTHCTQYLDGGNYFTTYIGSDPYVSKPVSIEFNPNKFYYVFFYQYWSLSGSADNNSYPYGSFMPPSENYIELGSLKHPYLKIDGAVYKTPSDPSTYYAVIRNVSLANFRGLPTTASEIIKTLPQDWIVKVVNSNAVTINDGFEWLKVIEPTDGSEGYIASKEISTGIIRLSYDSVNQVDLQNRSDVEISSVDRPAKIIEAVNHYYDNADTIASINSSDDSPTHKISDLKTNNFPKKLIYGLIGQESGGVGFNNENVSFDYGHGINQITSKPSEYDNRGIASNVEVLKCSFLDNSYNKCYAQIGDYNYYKHYDNVETNPIYKQYSNKSQSIYANTKDGLRILKDKQATIILNNEFSAVPEYNISSEEMRDFSIIQRYNGAPWKLKALYEIYDYKKDGGILTDAFKTTIWDNYMIHMSQYFTLNSTKSWTEAAYNACDISLTYSEYLEKLLNKDPITNEYITYNDGTGDYRVINGDPFYLSHIADKIDTGGSAFGSAYEDSSLATKMRYVNENVAILSLGSPGYITVSDKLGRKTGLINGKVKNEIPNTVYDEESKTFTIFFPSNDLIYEVTGTENGKYGFIANMIKDGNLISFDANGINTTKGEKHKFQINWKKLENKAKDSVKFTDKNNKTYNVSNKLRVNEKNISTEE